MMTCLPAFALDQVAAAVLLHGLGALGAGLGVGRQPVGRLVLSSLVNFFCHFCNLGWQTGMPLSNTARWVAMTESKQPNSSLSPRHIKNCAYSLGQQGSCMSWCNAARVCTCKALEDGRTWSQVHGEWGSCKQWKQKLFAAGAVHLNMRVAVNLCCVAAVWHARAPATPQPSPTAKTNRGLLNRNCNTKHLMEKRRGVTSMYGKQRNHVKGKSGEESKSSCKTQVHRHVSRTTWQ